MVNDILSLTESTTFYLGVTVVPRTSDSSVCTFMTFL